MYILHVSLLATQSILAGFYECFLNFIQYMLICYLSMQRHREILRRINFTRLEEKHSSMLREPDFCYLLHHLHHYTFAHLPLFIPSHLLFLSLPSQCVRRYADERDQSHVYNSAKYLSAMTTVALKVAFSQQEGVVLGVLFAISAFGSALFQIYWDLVNDWGLLRKGGTSFLLREKLMLRNKWMYYVAMVRGGVEALGDLRKHFLWLLHVHHTVGMRGRLFKTCMVSEV